MIEIETVSSIGNISVATQQNRGHPPEYWAERATERICGISENAAPHVKQQAEAFRVAIGMSLISMIAMESSMNATDLLIMGEPSLTWWVIPIMLFVGFITPWPYNYWRLKKYGISCH